MAVVNNTMTKKAFFLVGILHLSTVFFLTRVTAISAEEITASRPAQVRKELREEIKDDKKELRTDIKALKMVGKRLTLEKAVLTAKASDTVPTTLTVLKDGKSYTINIGTTTVLRRRFGGKGALGEMAINDTLSIVGKWVDEAQTTIDAKLVRDESIQKRLAVFVGKVKSVNGSTIVLESVARGAQTVTVSAGTKYVARNQVALTLTDIKEGHLIRVKGLWNRQLNSVTEVSHIKDYSLPTIKPTKAAPTPTTETE